MNKGRFDNNSFFFDNVKYYHQRYERRGYLLWEEMMCDNFKQTFAYNLSLLYEEMITL